MSDLRLMSTAVLNSYLNEKLDAMNRSCHYMSCGLNDFYECSKLLEAAGHDSSDLQQALHQTVEAFTVLKGVNQIACARFKVEGVKFHVVSDKNVISQLERDSLK